VTSCGAVSDAERFSAPSEGDGKGGVSGAAAAFTAPDGSLYALQVTADAEVIRGPDPGDDDDLEER